MPRYSGVASDPTSVDLFCGAGGLSHGFAAAGFRGVLAIDHDENAVRTYARNLGRHVMRAEIDRGTTLPAADVIAGGPPCQGFSSAGLRQAADERNSLVGVFAELVAAHRPSAFLFENVEGFLTADDGAHVFALLNPLIEAGYSVHLRKINAASYGVPQHRKRVIAIGGLGWAPTFPVPTHCAFGAPGSHLGGRGLPAAPSIADAIAGLPPAASLAPGVPEDHYARPIVGTALRIARALRPGQTMRDLPEELWHATYRRRAYRRVMDGTPSERRGGPPAGRRRLRATEPSKAITGGARGEFLHPAEDRPLTLRECARIQTFDDTFLFCGSASERAQLIGNAVPPALAKVFAEQLTRDLRSHQTRAAKGQFVTFVPTLSEGMSPALRGVVDRIVARFQPQGERRELLLWD